MSDKDISTLLEKTDPTGMNQETGGSLGIAGSIEDMNTSQRAALGALQSRYENPNWFKIAAALAKPQLGGFLASMGSAAEVEGERKENQRQQEIPIASMRAQIARSNVTVQQNKAATEIADQWRIDGSNSEDLAKARNKAMALSPTAPASIALDAQMKTQLEVQRQNSVNVDLALKQISALRVTGGYVPPWLLKAAYGEDYNGGKPPPERPAATAGEEKSPAKNPESSSQPRNEGPAESQSSIVRMRGDIESTTRELQRLNDKNDPKGEGREIISSEKKKAEAALAKLLGQATAPKSGQAAPYNNPKTLEQQQAQVAANELQKAEASSSELKTYFEHTPQSVADKSTLLSRTATLLKRPDIVGTADKPSPLGLLFGDPGVMEAIKNAAASGVGGQIGIGGMSVSASMSAPVEKFMQAKDYPAATRQAVREIVMNISRLQSAEMGQNLRNNTGGGHANAQEFTNALAGMTSASDPIGMMKGLIGTSMVTNEKNGAHNAALSAWRNTPENQSRGNHDYIGSEPYNAIVKRYVPLMEQAQKLRDAVK